MGRRGLEQVTVASQRTALHKVKDGPSRGKKNQPRSAKGKLVAS